MTSLRDEDRTPKELSHLPKVTQLVRRHQVCHYSQSRCSPHIPGGLLWPFLALCKCTWVRCSLPIWSGKVPNKEGPYVLREHPHWGQVCRAKVWKVPCAFDAQTPPGSICFRELFSQGHGADARCSRLKSQRDPVQILSEGSVWRT